MFKDFSAIASLVKQAQGMSSKIQEMKERLAAMRSQGQAGGGLVTVEVNGHLKLTKCRIDKTLIQSGDTEMIEELICAATNQALDKIRQTQQLEMKQLTGGVNIPGLSDIFGGMGLGG